MPTHVELVTPERVLYAGEADHVVLRTDGGEIMFLPNHTDFVGGVDICVARIAPASGGSAGSTESGVASEVKAAVAGGFVHVAANRVTILASIAELASEIDVARANQALAAAQAAAGSAEGVTGAGGGDHEDTDDSQPKSSTMLALLHPELPSVRERRAQTRLEAAGLASATGAAQMAPSSAH